MRLGAGSVYGSSDGVGNSWVAMEMWLAIVNLSGQTMGQDRLTALRMNPCWQQDLEASFVKGLTKVVR